MAVVRFSDRPPSMHEPPTREPSEAGTDEENTGTWEFDGICEDGKDRFDEVFDPSDFRIIRGGCCQSEILAAISWGTVLSVRT